MMQRKRIGQREFLIWIKKGITMKIKKAAFAFFAREKRSSKIRNDRNEELGNYFTGLADFKN
jgi:hypothetical protein